MKKPLFLFVLAISALIPGVAFAGIYTSANLLYLAAHTSQWIEFSIHGRPDRLDWEFLKGTCYSHTFASAKDIQHAVDKRGNVYWKARIAANRPGNCRMYFSGGGGETSFGVNVH